MAPTAQPSPHQLLVRLARVQHATVSAAYDDVDMTGKFGWHVINGRTILEFLKRAHAGEDPDALYLEIYVNSDIKTIEGKSDE